MSSWRDTPKSRGEHKACEDRNDGQFVNPLRITSVYGEKGKERADMAMEKSITRKGSF